MAGLTAQTMPFFTQAQEGIALWLWLQMQHEKDVRKKH